MNKLVMLFILMFFLISCSGNKKSNLQENKIKIQKYTGAADTIINIGNDTISLFYQVQHNKIRVEANLNKNSIFEKTFGIDDFISDAPYKEKSYFDKLFYTGFESDTKEIVFTTYLKRTDKTNFNMEATFTVDLKGNFNLVTE